MMYTSLCRALLVLFALGASLGASECEREHTDYETTGTDSDADTDTDTDATPASSSAAPTSPTM
jgi:hypothetical protein